MLTKSERTRLHIIEKASHLFNQKGFYGTSMSDIMEVTGLAKGGVYGNFESKEEILLESFDHSFRKVADEIVFKIKSTDNAIDKLNAIVDYYYNYHENSPTEGGCPVLNYSRHMDNSIPQLTKAINKAIKVMLDTIVRIIEKGQKYHQIKKQIKPSMAADIIYSRLEGTLMLTKALNDNAKLSLLLDDIKNYIKELKA